MEDRHGIGGNRPPTDEEIILDKLESYHGENERLIKLGSEIIPETIEDDEQASNLANHLKDLKTLGKDITDIHKKEKEPFLKCGKIVDAWKTTFLGEINKLTSSASTPLIAWNNHKEELERKRLQDIADKARLEEETLLEASAHFEGEDRSQDADILLNEALRLDAIATAVENKTVVGRSRGMGSLASNKKPWTGKLVNRNALDLELLREFFSEDALDKAIKSVVRSGKREIKGAIVFQEDKLSIR